MALSQSSGTDSMRGGEYGTELELWQWYRGELYGTESELSQWIREEKLAPNASVFWKLVSRISLLVCYKGSLEAMSDLCLRISFEVWMKYNYHIQFVHSVVTSIAILMPGSCYIFTAFTLQCNVIHYKCFRMQLWKMLSTRTRLNVNRKCRTSYDIINIYGSSM